MNVVMGRLEAMLELFPRLGDISFCLCALRIISLPVKPGDITRIYFNNECSIIAFLGTWRALFLYRFKLHSLNF